MSTYIPDTGESMSASEATVHHLHSFNEGQNLIFIKL